MLCVIQSIYIETIVSYRCPCWLLVEQAKAAVQGGSYSSYRPCLGYCKLCLCWLLVEQTRAAVQGGSYSSYRPCLGYCKLCLCWLLVEQV